MLGTALAIKMIAYVGVAPIVGGFADRLPRRAFLVAWTWCARHRVASALRDGDLAGLRPDLSASVRLRRPSRRPSRRRSPISARGEGLHARPLALAPGLRPGEPSEPDARGGIAHGDRLPLALRRDGDRLPGLGGARPVGPAAAADARRARRRHLREDDAGQPHLSGDAAPARTARAQPLGRVGRSDGDREHRSHRARALRAAGFRRGDRARGASAAARWPPRCCCPASSTGSRTAA